MGIPTSLTIENHALTYKQKTAIAAVIATPITLLVLSILAVTGTIPVSDATRKILGAGLVVLGAGVLLTLQIALESC